MVKNWQAIARVKDPVLKAFLISATEPETLRGAEAGFPELFSKTPVKMKVYPASALRAEAFRQSKEEEHNDLAVARSDGNFEWSRALGDEVPVITFDSLEGDDAPDEILQQLIGQKFGCGMKVKWQGGRYLVVFISPLLPYGSIVKKAPEVEILVIAPAGFIDLKS